MFWSEKIALISENHYTVLSFDTFDNIEYKMFIANVYGRSPGSESRRKKSP